MPTVSPQVDTGSQHEDRDGAQQVSAQDAGRGEQTGDPSEARDLRQPPQRLRAQRHGQVQFCQLSPTPL